MIVKPGLFTAILALVGTFGFTPAAQAQNEPPPNPQAIGAEVAKSQARLLAQCPSSPVPANADNLPVHVTTWGDVGPAVFLVHGGVQGGIGGGPDNFVAQKPLADRGWRLSLIARPGFGMTPSRGPDDQMADATLIADRLGTNSHLIGHSFGGAEALLAAAKRPDAVRSLILIEPALQSLQADGERRPLDGAQESVPRILQALLSAQTPADFAASFAAGLGSSADGGPNRSSEEVQKSPENATKLGCTLLHARIASPAELRQAAQIVVAARIPVLTISGGYARGQDAISESVARQLQGRHSIVSSPNHFIQQSNPDAFNKTVDEFMRTAEGRN